MRLAMLAAVIAVPLLSVTVLAQAPGPAPAATPPSSTSSASCKDIVTAKSRSAAQVSDASRERIARQHAIDGWRRRVRDTYGWRYRFWSRAQEREITCGGGASAKHCTARARPCKLL